MIYTDYGKWYQRIIGEDVDTALKSANDYINAGRTKKKQAELEKAKDGVMKKQKQLMDIKNGK